MVQIRQLFSVALIVVGLLLVTNAFSLATIIYPAKFWYSLHPDGASNAPTMITKGSAVQLKAQLVYYDVNTGVQLPGNYLTWTPQVTIRETGQTIVLSNGDVVSCVENQYSTFVYTAGWNVPAEEGKTYTFDWLVILRNNDNVEYGSQSTTTYAKTIAAEPDGYFTVNGQNADQQTIHVITNPNIQLGFIATKNADKLLTVYVEVWQGNTKLTTITLTGTARMGSYTLPSYNTYQLKGFYTWTGGAQPIQRMSVTANWEVGELTKRGPAGIGINQVIGVGSIFTGTVLLIKRKRN